MFENMENIKVVSSYHRESKHSGNNPKKLRHAFVIKTKGYAEYVVQGKTIRLNEGEMIFLPKDSAYTYVTHSQNGNNGNTYTSINFEADIKDPVPRVYSLENFYEAGFLSESFPELWNFGSISDKYKCLSVLYDLLSFISRTEHLGSAEQKKYALIEPAVQYLRKHIFDCAFQVQKLPLLCGISDTYFRKIFTSRFHMTPQDYVIHTRISRARSIIESGDFESVKEVADAVGYSDPLYFSKAFKKICGVCPSNLCE